MSLKFSTNLSMLFTEIPFLERFERAAAAGFSAVEFLFPYDAGVQAVKEKLLQHKLNVALFNLHAGDAEQREWGTLSNPERRDYFKWSFTTAFEAAQELGCVLLNMMFGQKVEGLELAAQIDCACENLSWAASQSDGSRVELLLEPLNEFDFPNYALVRTAIALEVIKRVNHPRVRLQYDLYHAQLTEGNLTNTLERDMEVIGHIQIADVPGRHQPGTGEINFPNVFQALERFGYQGFIGLEYKPAGGSEESLGWLPRTLRAAK